MAIRVLIADDHAIVREGIRSLLEREPDFEVVGEARDGSEAVDKALALRPDVVLMDLSMPVMGGLEATESLRARDKSIRILGLTVHEAPDYLFRMLQAGASGYMLKKDATSFDLMRAIRITYEDGSYLPPLLAKKVVETLAQRAAGRTTETPERLTEREQQVLRFTAEGYTNQEIGNMLCLSHNTIQTYRLRIMRKLHLRTRADLVKYALDKGVIRPDLR